MKGRRAMVYDVNDSRLMKQWTALACGERVEEPKRKDRPVLAAVCAIIFFVAGVVILWKSGALPDAIRGIDCLVTDNCDG